MIGPGATEIARIAQRLSVLLAAGIPPAAAWGYLDAEQHHPYVNAIAAAAGDGGDVAGALGEQSAAGGDRAALGGIAAAWRVATSVGAPLASTLAEIAESLRDAAEAQREAAVALAGPVATARLVMALPLVGLLGSSLMGFDTVHALLGTGAGRACLVGGLALLVAGWRWNVALIRRARPRGVIAGLHFDLFAIAMTGGGSLDAARGTVESALAEFEISHDSGVEAVLSLSQRAGAPAAQLLRAEAREARRDARARARESVAVLGVRLMIPLGVCVLPAFLLLGIAPLVIAVISSTVTQF